MVVLQFHCAPYGVIATIKCSCSPAGAAPSILGGRGSVPLLGNSGMVVTAHILLLRWLFWAISELAPSLDASSASSIGPSFMIFVMVMCIVL
jgi:hypothetical protein